MSGERRLLTKLGTALANQRDVPRGNITLKCISTHGGSPIYKVVAAITLHGDTSPAVGDTLRGSVTNAPPEENGLPGDTGDTGDTLSQSSICTHADAHAHMRIRASSGEGVTTLTSVTTPEESSIASVTKNAQGVTSCEPDVSPDKECLAL